MEFEKSPFCSHYSKNWFSQELSMDIKTSGFLLDEKQYIYSFKVSVAKTLTTKIKMITLE